MPRRTFVVLVAALVAGQRPYVVALTLFENGQTLTGSSVAMQTKDVTRFRRPVRRN